MVDKKNKSFYAEYIMNHNKLNEFDLEVKTLAEVKGLEFNNVIAITKNMSKSEKYVTYTRTKKKLLVIS